MFSLNIVLYFRTYIARAYKKTLELKREKGDARELAKTIEQDDLFSIFVTNEKTERIVEALNVASVLSGKEGNIHLEDSIKMLRNNGKLRVFPTLRPGNWSTVLMVAASAFHPKSTNHEQAIPNGWAFKLYLNDLFLTLEAATNALYDCKPICHF